MKDFNEGQERCETVRRPALPRWATGRGTGVLEGPRGGVSRELKRAA